MGKVYRADILYFVAHPYAVSTEYALMSISRDTCGRVIDEGLLRGIREADIENVKAHRQILKLAFAVVVTRRTVSAVIRKQKL